ncbi:MAG: branched-chain amino acid ABC transporter permease [Cenarchaeum sp. SB0665_bin_23]|nr:branched-chain amino acid ABC transporter permease [Cenarchaeum sp. SB0667_bin_13]MXY38092.1 branched-chain amino acid ABC transporter permease [Cenarchaeum sp. SB0664_bin_35]MXY60975.1 branched-chain amino acid ABC transporter permease [Cenarchaeum sp. SB0665_bin_23]MYB46917.1 branched-chain amino acid ABC transporter permease [Cenarchaeum sp. SB0662_bin_33]MYC79554.1 branched-chain amino acid ABC transporter permease [Cenarchaeum sp. SB0661_bin_35]MYG33730.1 branched-chain amino acid ABC 
MINPVFFDAAVFASLLVLLSLGLTLTYLTTKVPNFAHASFATLGVYMTLIAVRVWDTNPYIAVPIAFLLSGLVAITLYVFILKPLARRGATEAIQMIATLAFDMILIAGLNIMADYLTEGFRIKSREFTLRSYDLEFMDLPMIVFIAPIAVAAIGITLYFILKKTKFGIAVRASTENPDLSGTVGINVNAVYGVAWMIAGGLAGVAGALMALWFLGDPNLGPLLLPSIFAASIAGGLMSIFGAVAGGLLVGLAEVLGTRFLAGELGSWLIAYRPLIPLIIIAVTLLFVPNGIAGIDWSKLRSKIWRR